MGIDAVYQTLALADRLDPAANMFLGNELTTKVMGVTVPDIFRLRTESERVLVDRLGVRLKSLDTATESLSGGQRHAAAIPGPSITKTYTFWPWTSRPRPLGHKRPPARSILSNVP